MCAGLTLGKLNAVCWCGDAVRQPATSASNNNRAAQLDIALTVGRRCRDAQTAAKTSEAMFLPVRSLTSFRSPTPRPRQSGSFALPESESVSRCVHKSAGNKTEALELIFRKKMFMPVGRQRVPPSNVLIYRRLENQCGASAVRAAARAAVGALSRWCVTPNHVPTASCQFPPAA